jgi:putative ABC transport system permease protein
VVLSRLISTQREQIAALKAFGYSHWEVGLHYMKLVLFVVVVGVALGSTLGWQFGKGMTEMYAKFYKFPVFLYEFDVSIVSLALLVASLAAILGTLGAVRKAVKLPPAEAMRPEPPASYKPTFIERVGLQGLLSQPARMILRHLERKPVQALLSVLGISLAASILVLGSFTEDCLSYLMDFQFSISQKQDVTVTFVEPAKTRVVNELCHLPGVEEVEPFRSVAVRLVHGPRSKRLGVVGLPSERRLNLALDQRERLREFPPDGLILSTQLAKMLDIHAGDRVIVEVLEGKRPIRDMTVVMLLDDYAGANAYMDLAAIPGLSGEGHSYSGAYLTVDSAEFKNLYQKLKQTPRVAGVAIQSAAIQSFQDTVAENLLRMRMYNVIFAVIIACGVVYNTARISLSERSRELATLRVMGFTRGEISYILLGELAVITLIAIPFGLALGYFFAWLLTVALVTELFRIPLVVYPHTYAFAASIILGAAIMAGLIVRRKLDHLDLVAVLKSRE